MAENQKLRCGIVGAGRTRTGLGPFLASFLEEAGAEIVAVAGRDLERAAVAAADLESRLGHGVRAAASVEDLLGQGLDALVIAAPDGAHLASLRAAVAASVPVLCEKPLVSVDSHDAVAPLLEEFRSQGLLLVENCQWPLVLPVVAQIHPEIQLESVKRFGMRLAPKKPGISMFTSSVSHLLSMVQALFPESAPDALELSNPSFVGECGVPDGLSTDLEVRDSRSGRRLACHLELRVCPEQPRPVWLQFDEARIDREVDMATYQISFRAGERMMAIDDPTRTLVYRFLDHVRTPSIERNRTETNRVEWRAESFHRLVRGLENYLSS